MTENLHTQASILTAYLLEYDYRVANQVLKDDDSKVCERKLNFSLSGKVPNTRELNLEGIYSKGEIGRSKYSKAEAATMKIRRETRAYSQSAKRNKSQGV